MLLAIFVRDCLVLGFYITSWKTVRTAIDETYYWAKKLNLKRVWDDWKFHILYRNVYSKVIKLYNGVNCMVLVYYIVQTLLYMHVGIRGGVNIFMLLVSVDILKMSVLKQNVFVPLLKWDFQGHFNLHICQKIHKTAIKREFIVFWIIRWV